MAVKVEVEFPVVTKTTPARGNGKVVIGTASLPAEFEELDAQSVPITVRVQRNHFEEHFRVDNAGQFFWKIGSRPPEPAYRASFFNAYLQSPGIIRYNDVERYFERSDREGLKAVFNKRDFDKPRQIRDRKVGSYDHTIVEQQIAAKTEQLRDYVVIGGLLYVKSEEPFMRVSKWGHLYFEHGDRWTTLAPNQCFALRELPMAVELSRRICGKDPDVIPEVELIDPERHSSTFLDQRIALVSRYVLDLTKEYINESGTEEIGRMLLAYAGERDLLEKVYNAAQQAGQGSITPSVLAAAESILYSDRPSPRSAVIDNVGKARVIIDFLREEWDERPVDIGLSMVANLR